MQNKQMLTKLPYSQLTLVELGLPMLLRARNLAAQERRVHLTPLILPPLIRVSQHPLQSSVQFIYLGFCQGASAAEAQKFQVRFNVQQLRVSGRIPSPQCSVVEEGVERAKQCHQGTDYECDVPLDILVRHTLEAKENRS
jgi:hypothetical protein